jgi:hypothetical protein
MSSGGAVASEPAIIAANASGTETIAGWTKGDFDRRYQGRDERC